MDPVGREPQPVERRIGAAKADRAAFALSHGHDERQRVAGAKAVGLGDAHRIEDTEGDEAVARLFDLRGIEDAPGVQIGHVEDELGVEAGGALGGDVAVAHRRAGIEGQGDIEPPGLVDREQLALGLPGLGMGQLPPAFDREARGALDHPGACGRAAFEADRFDGGHDVEFRRIGRAWRCIFDIGPPEAEFLSRIDPDHHIHRGRQIGRERQVRNLRAVGGDADRRPVIARPIERRENAPVIAASPGQQPALAGGGLVLLAEKRGGVLHQAGEIALSADRDGGGVGQGIDHLDPVLRRLVRAP